MATAARVIQSFRWRKAVVSLLLKNGPLVCSFSSLSSRAWLDRDAGHSTSGHNDQPVLAFAHPKHTNFADKMSAHGIGEDILSDGSYRYRIPVRGARMCACTASQRQTHFVFVQLAGPLLAPGDPREQEKVGPVQRGHKTNPIETVYITRQEGSVRSWGVR